MQEISMSRARKYRQYVTAVSAFLLGVLTGFSIRQYLNQIEQWRRGDQTAMRGVAQFNKQWTNRVTGIFAGRSRSPFALLRHVGRRSGREYATPVIAAPVSYGFVIPLAYGDSSDWYRNVLAEGGCTLEWQGNTYSVGAPELVDAASAMAAFPSLWRSGLGMYGIDRFVKVVNVPQRSISPTARTEQRGEPQPQRT